MAFYLEEKTSKYRTINYLDELIMLPKNIWYLWILILHFSSFNSFHPMNR